MATKRKKIILFKDGPEKGKIIRYDGPEGPPPQAHAAIDEDEAVIYERRRIKPKGKKIIYVYKVRSRQETKEATLHEGA